MGLAPVGHETCLRLMCRRGRSMCFPSQAARHVYARWPVSGAPFSSSRALTVMAARPGSTTRKRIPNGRTRGVTTLTIECAPTDTDMADLLQPLGASNNIVSASPLSANGSGLVGSGSSSGSRNTHRALVLDSAYRPINVISWFKAVTMDLAEKVDVLEYYDGAYAVSAYRLHQLPAVVRVRQFVDMHEVAGKVSLTRRNVMLRDRHSCQYCGATRDLTIDHVIPQSKGGQNTWNNLVTACMKCNQRKGHATLQQIGWRLRIQPREPTPYEVGIILGISSSDVEKPPPQWALYLQPYKEKLDKVRQRRAAAAVAAAAAAGPAVSGAVYAAGGAVA